MRSNRKHTLLGSVSLLVLLVLLVPTALAQEPTPTPDTWEPPVIYKYGDPCGDVADEVTFTINVHNPGQATWYNVRVTDEIDPHLRIDSVFTTMGTYTITGNTVVVTVASLAPGESFLITIETTVLSYPPEMVIYNQAFLEYVDPDDHPWGPIRTEAPVKLVPCIPEIPEASTLILLGGAATGLAGYVGLQIRARRRNRS